MFSLQFKAKELWSECFFSPSSCECMAWGRGDFLAVRFWPISNFRNKTKISTFTQVGWKSADPRLLMGCVLPVGFLYHLTCNLECHCETCFFLTYFHRRWVKSQKRNNVATLGWSWVHALMLLLNGLVFVFIVMCSRLRYSSYIAFLLGFSMHELGVNVWGVCSATDAA